MVGLLVVATLVPVPGRTPLLSIRVSDSIEHMRGVGTRLKKVGITDLDGLAALNRREVLAIPGIGESSLVTIVAALASTGRSLAADPYASYTCARDSAPARDSELRSYFLCEACRQAFSADAFSGRDPEWISGEQIEGYCSHCNTETVVSLTQWFLCGTCDRVIRSLGRGIASARYVETQWRELLGDLAELELSEVDPVTLQPRGLRSDPNRVATADFVARSANGSARLGLELKSGRSSLPHGGVGSPMAQFQLDTTDCDDIVSAASDLEAPVFLLHAQVIGRAQAPTERFVGVGLWFARPWDMIDNLVDVRRRPRETRDAAYYKTGMFRPFSQFVTYLEDEFDQDEAIMREEGFPLLYSR
ncbi:helix-hairpin-helix domain-containing protein [Agromyces sp. GXS1127]|uniref:helix-hairpin-helix domain-containing protein n=1 Tax=Agromyces sp. GXS1127 TaxID=3424181 RepID=UPI003D323959